MTASPSEPETRHEPYDLAVVGAGSAGLAGAVTAAELGLSVVLLDASAQTGGQFYRHPAPALGAVRPEALHHDWSPFADLRRRLAGSGVTHLGGHHVWSTVREDDGTWTVHAVTGADAAVERPARIRARTLLLATGAYERQLPFPGWTLPGVVGAGGAQAMLKSGLVLPGRRVVVAGSGPLLLAVASSLAAAGARVPAVVEATDYLRYVRSPLALLANPAKAAEALSHGAALLRHRVRVRLRSAVTEVHGTDRVEAVTVTRLDADWRPVPGTGRRITCDALAVGHGLVPQIELATTLGCATRRLPDGTLGLALDDHQETSERGLWAAGETGGVGGAELARTEGELAARAVAARLLGHRAEEDRIAGLRRRRDRLRAFADVMSAAHAPGPGWQGWLTDDTDVCRCEEVTAGRIREAVTELGARDARTVKLLTRAGMGWCQGRMCGTAVSCLAARGGAPEPPAERRPFAVPVRLSALAALDGEPADPHPQAP
ncbi:NAD(P)/FAD-dependent oxidoreductase [Streptomyces sp. TLI_105]|uniref:FAD/NAD(P)-dependent oxidoreductase n=1 Tax=Streptomyces sp. TLI_105 TaxID=1881019 RepID=UPI00089A8795|nr:NAD(P)/FAD-dependent oxidoreductase [Streptomyces sp. TLI_105]SEE01473.1 Pyruvate/2-oxoglutarate dehydrogenase complex, dihydrolipoamide dehydrogenase (E3) component [Streptomyces sp. TLI_105]